MLRAAYEGRRIFITGHTGFKGAWLLKMLEALGVARIKGYALGPQTRDDLFCLIKGNELCHSVTADLRDRERLSAEMIAFQPDFVFHLGAQPLVKLSYENPCETFEINAIGTANVLEAVRVLDRQCSVVLITTDKVYHNNEWIYPYRENDRLGGYDPYSASKACAELVIDSYRNAFFDARNYDSHRKGIAVARAGNVIGGGDWAKDRLFPDIARALGRREPVIIRNPDSVRPWQHVLEPLSGYLLLGAKLYSDPLRFGQAYNFGPATSDQLTVQEMVNVALENWQGGAYRVAKNEHQPHEATLLKLDISKAEAELGWKPLLEACTAVHLTSQWYKAFFEDRDQVLGLTEKQVAGFLTQCASGSRAMRT